MTIPPLDELKENFALFDDWEERYRYLIDLGRQLPKMEEALKAEENIVKGCTSQVWMVADISSDRLSFVADSDAHIVRGLIAFLMSAYQDQPLDQLKNIDVDEAFKEVGLDSHLSPNRRNGFFSMVERIKSYS